MIEARNIICIMRSSPAGIRALYTVLGYGSPKCPKSSEALLPQKKITKLVLHLARIAFWYRALPTSVSIDDSLTVKKSFVRMEGPRFAGEEPFSRMVLFLCGYLEDKVGVPV
ncbi:hypothetical protein AB4556_24650, partial [Vibrio splendidus]